MYQLHECFWFLEAGESGEKVKDSLNNNHNKDKEEKGIVKDEKPAVKARSSDEVQETENEKLAIKARSSDKVQETKKEKAAVKARSSDKVQETEDEKLNGGEEDEKDALDDEVCICEFSVNYQV